MLENDLLISYSSCLFTYFLFKLLFRYIRSMCLVFQIKRKQRTEAHADSLHSLNALLEVSEDSSIQMKALQDLGEGFFQIIFQMHFISVLWILWVASLLYGSDKKDLYYQKGKVFSIGKDKFFR